MKRLVFLIIVVSLCLQSLCFGARPLLAEGPAPVPVPVDKATDPLSGNQPGARMPVPREPVQGDASALAGTVYVSSVWTTDSSHRSKTTFAPGETIHFFAAINNTTGYSAYVYMTYRVDGPSGPVVSWSGMVRTGSGTWWWYLPKTTPSYATPGNYTFRQSTSYNGQTTSRSMTFQVSRTLLLPFSSGQTWYVCQGYKGTASGTHNYVYALDLTVESCRGANGCLGNINASRGRQLRAPAAGTVTNVGVDLVCLTMDSGGSLMLGHMNDRRTGKVSADAYLGTTTAASSSNGGYAHIHIQAYSKAGCTGSSLPFDDAHNLRFANAPNLYDTGRVNQWAGTALRRP